MAINLSTRTQTTGPVSRDVFDPNVGYKSGLDSLAKGLGAVSSAAGQVIGQRQIEEDKEKKKQEKLFKNVSTS